MNVPTPAIVVDDSILRDNLKRMSDYAKQHGLNLRPHTKTHKSLYVGSLQMEYGAIGLTVAKVGEAEVMASICSDIMLAYPIVDPHRCERVARLADQVTVRVGTDSKCSVERLNDAASAVGTKIGVLIDFDLGYGRTGAQTVDAAIELAEFAEQRPSIRVDGIMLYSGHVRGDDGAQAKQFDTVAPACSELLAAFDRKGICRDIVSSGSTPSAFNTHLLDVVTEFRPGTYVYNDLNIVRGGYGTMENCAACVRATVVSDSVPGQIVLDAGSKTLSSDLCGPAADSGFGFLVEYPDAKIAQLTEEHAQVDVSHSARRPSVGDVVSIIPNHICPCVNLQDQFWVKSGDDWKQRPVDARGCVV